MNIHEEQNPVKLIKLRKRHLIMKQHFYKSLGIQYRLHLHFIFYGKNENMNIYEEQNPVKLIRLRKRHLIMKQHFYKSTLGIQYSLHLHFIFHGKNGSLAL